jgi:hypothetical protein
LRDKNGLPGDPQTIRGWIKEPGTSPPTEILWDIDHIVGSGIYETSWIIAKEGEHWLRIQTTGEIHTAIEKKFDGARRMVTIP